MNELTVVQATPDASLSSAIGLHHTLQSAIADLIDNSIDAGASHVLVRFVRDGVDIVGLLVIDDGCGMDADTIDSAMIYGSRRDYTESDLGHFGVGMKAASLSQADELLVWSRAAGHPAQGRKIRASKGSEPQIVTTFDVVEAAAVLDATKPRFPFSSGTVVEWKDIRKFSKSVDETEQDSWIEQVIDDVRNHLGVVFHRLLEKSLSLTVDVFDFAYGRAGEQRTVIAANPFDYPRTGHVDYPKTVDLVLAEAESRVTLHIWPARSNTPEFRLFGSPGREHQGLYFYRHDRLLQIAGWNDVVSRRPDYGLARVAIDLDDALARHVTINPEKIGVRLDATASRALQDVLQAGYLVDAEGTVRAARSHQPKPITVVQPESGLPEDVLDTFSDSFTFSDGRDPVRVEWRVLSRTVFFEVDLDKRTLWINARFRRELLGFRSRDSTDAPVIKTLLFLLVQNMFDVERHSTRNREQMQVWQDVLVAAVVARREQLGDRI
ncbi:ATP-binding protein [Actinomycetes bacterium M1A6_2h]